MHCMQIVAGQISPRVLAYFTCAQHSDETEMEDKPCGLGPVEIGCAQVLPDLSLFCAAVEAGRHGDGSGS